MQTNQIAMFTLYHRNIPVTFTPTDPATLPATFSAIAAAIDAALAAGWAAGKDEDGAGDGKERRRVVISGWVYGKSLNGIPLVWLYSDNFPYLSHKVTQVYQERIKELPGVVIPTGLKPIKGQAPEKKAAIEDGDYHKCEPFTIELVDTGEMFGEYQIFNFERVIPSTKPAPSAQPITTTSPTPAANGNGPALSEKQTALIEYGALGIELYSAGWPAMSKDRVRALTGGQTDDAEQLSVEQLNTLIVRLKTAKANKSRVTPPPAGK
jgi:hypothetical protein